MVTAFLQQKKGAAALTAALARLKLPADVAKIAARTVRAFGRPAPSLLDALGKAGGLTGGPRILTTAEMRQMVADVLAHGDPDRGEAVYRRKEQNCTKCHAIAGAGGQVGPDLVSIGASAQVDYLIESILQPNKAVKENYHSIVIGTKDGKLFTGIKVRETNAELVLRDAEDKEIAIPLHNIDERAVGGSLMPDGLTDTLTNAELVDLTRFLSELGKVGPYAVSQARLVRRWQVLEPTAEARRYLQQNGLAGAAQNNPALTWTPAYSKVSGVLPLDDLPRFEGATQISAAAAATAFVRCQFEGTAGGPVKLRWNSAAGGSAWVDGKAVTFKEDSILDMPPGLHTMTLAIDLRQRRQGLRCQLDDVPGSAARVRIVTGK
jgi:putative heme-binding domain-containing protein